MEWMVFSAALDGYKSPLSFVQQTAYTSYKYYLDFYLLACFFLQSAFKNVVVNVGTRIE